MCSFHYVSDISGYTEVLYHPKTVLLLSAFMLLRFFLIFIIDVFRFLAPTAAPESFTVTNKSASSLQLNWLLPPKEKTHGVIRHYLIRYRVVNCSNGKDISAGWNETTVRSNLTTTIIGKLSFWTCYDVNISAVTVGEGPFANQKKKRTSEHGMLFIFILLDSILLLMYQKVLPLCLFFWHVQEDIEKGMPASLDLCI